MDLPTEAESVKVIEGDCLSILRDLPDGCVDAVITDPPYGLEFMGKEWDSFRGEAWRVGAGFSKPGIGDRKTAWPAFGSGDSANATCGVCGGRMRGANRCGCDTPDWRVKGKPLGERNGHAERGRAFGKWCQQWAAAALQVLKPGGYAAVFGGTRTYHRLACAVEDAGFEVRDCLMWVYGTGFPKGKGCLKPAYEPILLCRRPGLKVLPLGIDECRVPTTDKLGGGAETVTRADQKGNEGWVRPWMSDPQARLEHAARVQKNVAKAESLGRWPANVVHDGSGEVLEAFAAFGERKGGGRVKGTEPSAVTDVVYGKFNGRVPYEPIGDSGSAARFFYCAKASKSERGEGNTHPTVKPIALCEWLVRLVCPAGGLVLDPFGGSGTTGIAAMAEGRQCLLIEKEPAYAAIARKRVAEAMGAGSLFAGATS